MCFWNLVKDMYAFSEILDEYECYLTDSTTLSVTRP